MRRIMMLLPVAGRMDMRRTIVLLALAAVAVLLVGVAALLWTQQAQAQEPCTTDFCIDKTANRSTVEVGQQITFTITQRCVAFPSCNSDIPLVDVLPSGLTFVSVNDSQPDYQCSRSGNTVTCPEGRASTPTSPFTATIVATTTECGTFTNTASAGPDVGEVSFTVEGCVPTTKEQCKNNGWRNFENPDGSPMFKNQGDCVSYVATHGKNEPGQKVANTM
jgi:uncharacterized repeat protein (TIGR01451 family)